MTERTARPIGRLRRLAAVLILMCLLYFAVGALLVWFEFFPLTIYLKVAGGVGALASVLGLLSLARPSIAASDLAELDTQVLKRLGETTEEVRELEEARSKAEKDLSALELQRKEMEALVRKASLSLFLEEQKRLYEQRIVAVVEGDPELDRYLAELSQINEKLAVLNLDIESDPRVDLLDEVVAAVRMQHEAQLPLDSFFGAFGKVVGDVMDFYGRLLGLRR